MQPENRMLMANVWYPAAVGADGEEGGSGGGGGGGAPGVASVASGDGGGEGGDAATEQSTSRSRATKTKPRWRDDFDDAATASLFSFAGATGGKALAARRSKQQQQRNKNKRAHWLDPKMAATLAESFAMPAWIVNYFRLVKMEAIEDAPVADPPRSRTRREKSRRRRPTNEDGAENSIRSRGFPVVLFSHSFTGVKEQNSALLQEIASWGHIVVAVDHPHDAALVLYPDGSTADFRGYDMPKESEPRNWWRFRHEHARWRALDLAHALERTVELSFDERSPLRGKIDLSRVACVGHSFGGAAAVMLAQMDPRITRRRRAGPVDVAAGARDRDGGVPLPVAVSWRRPSSCGTATSSASPTGRCRRCCARRRRRRRSAAAGSAPPPAAGYRAADATGRWRRRRRRRRRRTKKWSSCRWRTTTAAADSAADSALAADSREDDGIRRRPDRRRPPPRTRTPR